MIHALPMTSTSHFHLLRTPRQSYKHLTLNSVRLFKKLGAGIEIYENGSIYRAAFSYNSCCCMLSNTRADIHAQDRFFSVPRSQISPPVWSQHNTCNAICSLRSKICRMHQCLHGDRGWVQQTDRILLKDVAIMLDQFTIRD